MCNSSYLYIMVIYEVGRRYIGYTWNINNKWVEKARFYITGRNLFTISGYHRGLDKDAYCVNGMEPGLPYSKNGYYPSSRQFLFGIQLNF